MNATTNSGTGSVVTFAKATIYLRGMISMTRTEVRDLRIEIRPYAQYDSAVHVSFVPKGGRSRRGFVESHSPSLVVLDGWGHVEPASMFIASETSDSGVECSRGRYSACDPRCLADFGALLSAYVARTGAKIVADYRTHNASNRFSA
jgi:hypothetical protein